MKTLAQILLVAVLVLSCTAPTFAQEQLWKELQSKVGMLYQQGRYSEAAKVAQEALTVAEKTFGPNHHYTATSIDNLGAVYRDQGKYTEAEPLHKRALAIREKAFGPDHPAVAFSLNNLAMLWKSQGKYAEAEPLYKRSLKIVKKAFGPKHPYVATALKNLAVLYDFFSTVGGRNCPGL